MCLSAQSLLILLYPQNRKGLQGGGTRTKTSVEGQIGSVPSKIGQMSSVQTSVIWDSCGREWAVLICIWEFNQNLPPQISTNS